MDVFEVKKYISNLSEREKRDLIERLKAATGGYELDEAGNYRLSEQVVRNQILAQRVEQLIIPTINAGHVPIDVPDFVSRMMELQCSEEEILKTIAFFSKATVVPEGQKGNRLWWGFLFLLFLVAFVRACHSLM